jgi:hypothetical protein
MLLPLSGLCKVKIRPFAQIRTEMKNFVMHLSCNFRACAVRERASASMRSTMALLVYDPETSLNRLAISVSIP